MEIKSTDLSARLLATENLTVVRANTRTASFDIKSRVLTIPMWKDMTPEIEDMLIGHEVGHALYTLDQYMKPIEDNPKMMGYLNVLEDVRIEKLIKRKYPGLRKRMNEGYKQLNDRDFFGVSKAPLETLLLIDKINLYYKAGFQCGVKFTPEEKEFVVRAEKTETIEDVIQLAHDVYAFSKAQAEERKKQRAAQNPEDTEEEYEDSEQDMDGDPMDYDDSDFDEQSDEDSDNETGGRRSSTDGLPDIVPKPKKDPLEVSDEELESVTDKNFMDKLEDLADQDTQYVYHKIIKTLPVDPIVGYKTILKQTAKITGTDMEEHYPYYAKRYLGDDIEVFEKHKAEEFVKFKTSSQSTVNYLVKEFEMRKSAQLYKRAQTAKIGSLDMKRLWSYKLNDDLFKRVTTIPQGKNHGMIFLLDWSGSMDFVLEDTLKQVINLAMFCNKAQIPYRVLAFTTQYGDSDDEKRMNDYRINREFIRGLSDQPDSYLNSMTESFHLLELFSSKMTTSEFNTMSKRVLDIRFRWTKGFGTGGTPLNEALVWVYNNIGDYMKNHSIEKMSLITLTDGCGGTLYSTKGRLDERTTIEDKSNNWGYRHVKQKHFIRDDVTQKTYEITRQSGQQTETLIKMIRDRYNIKVVGFYICDNRRGALRSAIQDNVPNFNGSTDDMIDQWRKAFKQQGFVSVAGTGRDDLFVIPQSATKISEEELDVKAEANAKAIARNFSKYLNIKKTSRVLLNTFVGYVA